MRKWICQLLSQSDSLQPHSLSMEFFKQEYWSGLPFPSPDDLSDPGIEPGSPALQANFFFFFLSELLGKPNKYIVKSLSRVRLFETHGL